MSLSCNKCGSVDVYKKAKNENQTGLYCSDCGAWIKWLGKNERNMLIPTQEEIEIKKNRYIEAIAEAKEKTPSIEYLQGRLDGFKEGYAEAVKQLKSVI